MDLEEHKSKVVGLHTISIKPETIEKMKVMVSNSVTEGFNFWELEELMEVKSFFDDMNRVTFGEQKDVRPVDWKVLITFDKK